MIKHLKTTLLGLLAAGCCLQARPAAAADSLFSWTSLEALKMYHAYSASDGRTYIEQITVPASVRQVGGSSAEEYLHIKPQEMVIARAKAGVLADWHYAGASRHIIIPLEEEIVFDTGDGKLFHLKPGEAILAEDWTGKGHRSGCWSDTKPTCAVMDILFDANPRALPLRPPPSAN
jgi:hypothetical protein